MSTLIVGRIGAETTLQDGRRTGWQRFGVSTGGTMDRLAYAIAKVLVGNAPYRLPSRPHSLEHAPGRGQPAS